MRKEQCLIAASTDKLCGSTESSVTGIRESAVLRHTFDFLGFILAFFFIDCILFSALTPERDEDLDVPEELAVALGKTDGFALLPHPDLELALLEPSLEDPEDGKSAPRAFAKSKSSETANFCPPFGGLLDLVDLSFECEGDEEVTDFCVEVCAFGEELFDVVGTLVAAEVLMLLPLNAAQPANEPPVEPLPVDD